MDARQLLSESMMASRPVSHGKLTAGTRRRRIGLNIPTHLWPAVLITYAAVLPQELAINISGAALFPYRLALLLSVPWLLHSFVFGRIKANPVDAIAGLVSLWIVISMMVNESADRAFEFGVSNAIDFGLAYFAGRVSIRNTNDLRRYFVALLPMLVGLAALLMFESLNHQHILRPALAQAFGGPIPVIHDQARLGMYRAAGPFPHPILGGVFMASLLPLAAFAMDRISFRMLGILIASSMIFTVSSTAILSFLFCLVLMGVFWLQRESGGPVMLLTGLLTITVFAFVSVAADSDPFTFAIYRFTLNPTSGYWRLLTWQYAGTEALNNPIFGIGLRDWFRPPFMVTSSIDAHFLLWSMRFGMIAGIGCLLVFLGSAFYLLRGLQRQSTRARSASLGLVICLLSIAFSGFSVAFWGGLASWCYMLCGAAISMGTLKIPAAQISVAKGES